jgi:hypothetical protein
MDKSILIEMLVRRRVSTFRSAYGRKEWIVMEDLLEEGEGVKKQLGRFNSESQANRFMLLFREEMRKYYDALFNITINVDSQVAKPTTLMITKLLEAEIMATRLDPTKEPTGGREAAF